MSAAVSTGSLDAHEIQQQLHDGPLTAAIQPHKIPREIHLGPIAEIGKDFPSGCFARRRTRMPARIRSRDSIATQPLLCHYSATTTPLLDHYSATTSPLLDHYFTTTGCPTWIRTMTR